MLHWARSNRQHGRSPPRAGEGLGEGSPCPLLLITQHRDAVLFPQRLSNVDTVSAHVSEDEVP